VSPALPFEKAALIPDSVSCMYHAIKTQGNVRAGEKVLILGIGGLGIQGVQIAKYFGAEVFCTSRQDEKLKIAEEFGADHKINTKTTDLYREISRLTNGEMCDVVFDNIGIASSIQHPWTW
jgi:propanol-preferring alcohol dehydrogenase